MKKLFSILTATVIVLGMTATAYATTPFPDVDVDYNTITQKGTDDGHGTHYQDATIPVYGYIGADTDLVDKGDDASNPDLPPSSLSLINVRVPVKIIWAAFAEDYDSVADTTEVTSPDYYIQNLSYDPYGSDLKVSIESFSAKITNNNDANTVKDMLTLTFEPNGSAIGSAISSDADYSAQHVDGADVFQQVALLGGDLLSGGLGTGVYLNTSQLLVSPASDPILLSHGDSRTKLNSWGFHIGGSYAGAPPTNISYAPEYSIVFKFEAVPY